MCTLSLTFIFVYLIFTVEFLWSHTTESMCVGYMSAQDSKAKVSIPVLNTLKEC